MPRLSRLDRCKGIGFAFKWEIIAGIPFFNRRGILTKTTAAVAKRINWRKMSESKTKDEVVGLKLLHSLVD